jgi:hypothetical protein
MEDGGEGVCGMGDRSDEDESDRDEFGVEEESECKRDDGVSTCG